MKSSGEQIGVTPVEAAGTALRSFGRGIVRYDAQLRRLWLADQRVHHGLTGALIAGAGLAGLASKRMTLVGTLRFAMLGTALMADDWHDRSLWLTREHAPAGLLPLAPRY